VVEHLASLGGEVLLHRKLTRLHLEGGRIGAVTFAEPDPSGHDQVAGRPPGQAAFETTVPTKASSELVDRDFDHLICTVPATAFQELNRGDTAFWRIPEMAALQNLRGVAGLGLQIWHRERVTHRYHSVIAGLAGPLGYVLDAKHIVRDYREDPRYGAVLYFVGQETGHEHLTDEQHLSLCLKALTHLPGFEAIDRHGVLHYQVVRNRGAHKAYFYTEPGVQRFRPSMRTSLPNLWLAGDWVRSELDFPCMEAAVRTGRAAADAVIERLTG